MTRRGDICLQKTSLALAAGVLAIYANSAFACATCGCTLSTDAATGFSTREGWRVGLQYTYLNQDQLRHGTGTASVVPVGNELEHQTKNQYINASITYAPTPDWNVNLQIPYVIRDHSTYGAYDPAQPLVLDKSHSSSLGDVKLIGSYQGFLPTRNLGVQVGLKLPTGEYGDAVHFDSGDPLDTSLQPGTGSTDIIVGAYYYQALSQDFDGFANLQYEAAFKTRFDYRPGNQTNLSAGVRYMAFEDWVPQLQLNVTHRARDKGDNADGPDSAGTFVYVSPGLSYAATPQTQVYGFVQLPLHSNLSGWQLAPRWTASVGVSHTF